MSSLLRCVETADSGVQDDGVPWWMKYAGKAAGILGGLGRSSYTQLWMLRKSTKILWIFTYIKQRERKKGDHPSFPFRSPTSV
jgi:hypothetical protein